MFDDRDVYIDFDGVVLNTEERLEQMVESSGLSWREFLLNLNWEQFLHESSELNEALSILRELEKRKREVSILTKVNSLYELREKIIYLRDKNINIPIIGVPVELAKSTIVIPKKGEILIDDFHKNIAKWNAAGGEGFLYSGNDDVENHEVDGLHFLLK